jgi:hypothetical protein
LHQAAALLLEGVDLRPRLTSFAAAGFERASHDGLFGFEAVDAPGEGREFFADGLLGGIPPQPVEFLAGPLEFGHGEVGVALPAVGVGAVGPLLEAFEFAFEFGDAARFEGFDPPGRRDRDRA